MTGRPRRLWTVCLVGMFLGCGASTSTEDSADVNQDRIHQTYKIELSPGNSWRFEATFRFGSATGETLELNDPAQVTVNGDKMGKVSFAGTSYSLSWDDKPFTPNITFEWTDADGVKRVNDFVLPDPNVQPRGAVKRGESFNVTWKDARREKEGLHVRLWPDPAVDADTITEQVLDDDPQSSRDVSKAWWDRFTGAQIGLSLLRDGRDGLKAGTEAGGGMQYNLSGAAVAVDVED